MLTVSVFFLTKLIGKYFLKIFCQISFFIYIYITFSYFSIDVKIALVEKFIYITFIFFETNFISCSNPVIKAFQLIIALVQLFYKQYLSFFNYFSNIFLSYLSFLIKKSCKINHLSIFMIKILIILFKLIFINFFIYLFNLKSIFVKMKLQIILLNKKYNIL